MFPQRLIIMPPADSNLFHWPEPPKRFVRQLLTVGENRLELLMAEAQEERERLLRAILLALGVAVFGFLAGAALTVALVVLLWSLSPLAVLLTLTGIYTASAGLLYQRFRTLQRQWKTFPATLDQLKKDRVCLETLLS
jgi:uncharacterized membrane protein YqjE